MAAGWQFLVPQAIMLTIGTAIAGAQVGFAALKHAPPRASPPTAESDQPLSARQVLPALGSQIEAAEERLGAAGQGGFYREAGGKMRVAPRMLRAERPAMVLPRFLSWKVCHKNTPMIQPAELTQAAYIWKATAAPHGTD